MRDAEPDLSRIPDAVARREPALWPNPRRAPAAEALAGLELGRGDIEAAAARWRRFAPLLARLFPELAPAGGHVDSALVEAPALAPAGVRLLVKADHALPVTGCIKARGGVYEVLCVAERIAVERGLLAPGEDAGRLDGAEPRAAFGAWRIVVGSTGNLGFSVGTMARALGFRTEVHMSRDAKAWKKDRLRRLGAEVVEHAGDYGAAVAAARAAARADPRAYFVDDEDSVPLFLGYAVAALDLRAQLAAQGLRVDAEHPLIVHLPCGVGGAPGGIAFGLKHLFGDAAQCVFVEPVGAPCLLVQLAAGTEAAVPIAALGLAVDTAADGLAVGAASMFVARTVERLVDACATCADADLFAWAGRAWAAAGLRLEPSAAAGFCGLAASLAAPGALGAAARAPGAVHVVWTTGGAHLPEEEFAAVLARAKVGA
jgi:D-serine dehydratase